ncbi:hypothetical protein [Desulfonatronovibrio hydrogenovorans]|uniref:hypothetical protein n=1 Tax=Desulfonatronovibrio hydrogenovorans TaxID=53245 RepID=UPI000556B366|nr:hypothetical protein [Desulfonatronovibrio hydrogenovorans]
MNGWWTKWMKGTPYLVRIFRSHGIEPKKDIPSFIFEHFLDGAEQAANSRLSIHLDEHGPLPKSEAKAKWMAIYYEELRNYAQGYIEGSQKRDMDYG